MEPLEFREWLENCIRDAQNRGLSDEDILIALMEEFRSRLLKYMINRQLVVGGLKND